MGPSMQQLLIVLVIVVLLFGAKKIPELAKGVGTGIKNFKKAMKEDEEQNTSSASANPIEKTESKSETPSDSNETSEKKPS